MEEKLEGKKKMKGFGICFLTLGAILFFITPVMAQQRLVDTVSVLVPNFLKGTMCF